MKSLKIFLLLPLLFLTTCSEVFQNGVETPPLNPNLALPEMTVTEEGWLTLSKNGLDKEYLLQASFIDTSGLGFTAPNFQGAQSRIVYFKKNNNSLFLMESSKGLLSSEELPAEWILTEFKIIAEDENQIIFDFNEGMKSIFVGSDWYASDFQYGRTPTIAIQAPHAYLKEVKNENTRIAIRQIAQLSISFFVDILLPVEVVYYLENYQPDPSFKATKNEGFERVGYFEASPFVRPEFGDFQTYISKWSLNKPILFSISDNTLEEYIDAIKEGVLYWNKVFGGEVVGVDMAPPGIRAPHPDYNIIQWVTYHYAGFAYADAQMDPRSGEIRHAQIYLTTAHVVHAISQFDRWKKTKEEEKETNEVKKIMLGLKGFNNGLLCVFPANETLGDIRYLEKANPGVALKMSQDYIRNTTAHEVGHTLGLRHNFAASTSSELTSQEISDVFDEYLETGTIEVPVQVASSVMDYLDREGRVLMGRYIAQPNSPAPTYDKMAVGWGYYGVEPSALLEETLYCPDSLLFQYDDCLWRDTSHPTLFLANLFEQSVEKFPNLVAELFLAAKTNFDEEERKPVGQIELNGNVVVRYLTAPLDWLIKQFKDEVRSLFVERSLPPLSDINRDEHELATTRWIDKGIAQGGGIAKLLSLIGETSLYGKLNSAYERFVEVIESQKFRKGETVFGEPYEFTDQEITVMKRRTKELFDLVAVEAIRETTQILAGGILLDPFQVPMMAPPIPPERFAGTFRPIADAKGLETALGNWAEFIITENAEAWPAFDGELRLLSTNILLPFQGPTENWQKENRERVLQILLEKLEQRYGVPFDAVQPANLTEEEKALYEIEAMIIQILSGEEESIIPSPLACPERSRRVGEG